MKAAIPPCHLAAEYNIYNLGNIFYLILSGAVFLRNFYCSKGKTYFTIVMIRSMFVHCRSLSLEKPGSATPSSSHSELTNSSGEYNYWGRVISVEKNMQCLEIGVPDVSCKFTIG